MEALVIYLLHQRTFLRTSIRRSEYENENVSMIDQDMKPKRFLNRVHFRSLEKKNNKV